MPRPWSLVDFVLVMLGGFAGALVPLAMGAADGEFFVVSLLAAQYAGHLLVLWLLARARSGSDLGFSLHGGDILYVGLGLFLQLALALLFAPLAILLLPEGEPAQQVGVAITQLQTQEARLAALLVAVLLAPITEELAFRGVLLRALPNLGRRSLLVVTSLVFALFHLLGLDPARMLPSAAVLLPQLFIVGVVLGWVTLRSGRLGPAIFLHSGFNLLAALVLLLPMEVLEGLGG